MAVNDSLLGLQPDTGVFNWSLLEEYEYGYEDANYGNHGGPPMPDPELLQLQAVVRSLQMYYAPVVGILGLLGNIASIVTLSHSALRKISANQYLMGFLLAQTMYLLTLLHHWLNEHGIFFYSIGGWCQFITFTERVSTFLTMWYTLGLSIDGLIRVCFSDLELRMCTVWRSRIFMIGAAILAIVVYLNTSLTVAVNYYGNIPVCHAIDMFAKSLRTLEQIDIFVNCLIPYVTIVVMEVLMCMRMVVTYKRQSLLQSHTSSTSSSTSSSRHSRQVAEIVDEDNPPARFIVAFVLVFLLLNLPSKSARVYFTFRTFSSSRMATTLREFLIHEILKQFIKSMSIICVVFLFALHTAYRTVVWQRLCACCQVFKRCYWYPRVIHAVQSTRADSESYPLKGQGSPRQTNDRDTPTSTSFLCEIEVCQQHT